MPVLIISTIGMGHQVVYYIDQRGRVHDIDGQIVSRVQGVARIDYTFQYGPWKLVVIRSMNRFAVIKMQDAQWIEDVYSTLTLDQYQIGSVTTIGDGQIPEAFLNYLRSHLGENLATIRDQWVNKVTLHMTRHNNWYIGLDGNTYHVYNGDRSNIVDPGDAQEFYIPVKSGTVYKIVFANGMCLAYFDRLGRLEHTDPPNANQRLLSFQRVNIPLSLILNPGDIQIEMRDEPNLIVRDRLRTLESNQRPFNEYPEYPRRILIVTGRFDPLYAGPEGLHSLDPSQPEISYSTLHQTVEPIEEIPIRESYQEIFILIHYDEEHDELNYKLYGRDGVTIQLLGEVESPPDGDRFSGLYHVSGDDSMSRILMEHVEEHPNEFIDPEDFIQDLPPSRLEQTQITVPDQNDFRSILSRLISNVYGPSQTVPRIINGYTQISFPDISQLLQTGQITKFSLADPLMQVYTEPPGRILLFETSDGSKLFTIGRYDPLTNQILPV